MNSWFYDYSGAQALELLSRLDLKALTIQLNLNRRLVCDLKKIENQLVHNEHYTLSALSIGTQDPFKNIPMLINALVRKS